MAAKQKKRDLGDIQVLGVWNFTIQAETPLVWLRTGALDRYLLKLNIHTDLPSTAGMIFHSEADGPGVDGVSFWIERREVDGEMTRRYVLAGDGLESKPLATRRYPDHAGEDVEDVEVLVQGFTACIFVRKRTVQIRCRMKASRGSICFFNSTKTTEDGKGEDVHFSNCRITALRRGPLEVAGNLARREKALNELEPPAESTGDALDPLSADVGIAFGDDGLEKAEVWPRGFQDSQATTAAPESPMNSPMNSTHLAKSAAATSMGTFYKAGASTKGGFMNTASSRGTFGKQGSPMGTTSSTMFSGRTAGPAKLRSNLSDSALRQSGSALCGLSPATKGRGVGDEWIPLAMNPPRSEQAFVREHAIRPVPKSHTNSCQEFIKM